jgi:hypothetical protein
MTGIPPALPPTSAPAATPPAVVVATPVAEVPPQIAALPPNSVIDATVAAALQQAQQAQQAKAVVQLVTSLGNIAVRLPFPIPPNAALTLQLVGSGATLQLRVIAINGQPLPGAAGAAAAEPAGAGPAAELDAWAAPSPGTGPKAPVLNSFQPPAAGRPASTGAPVEIAVSPTGGGASGIAATVVLGSQPALPTGTQLILRLLGLETPPAATGTGPQGEPEATGPEAAVPNGGAGPNGAANPAAGGAQPGQPVEPPGGTSPSTQGAGPLLAGSSEATPSVTGTPATATNPGSPSAPSFSATVAPGGGLPSSGSGAPPVAGDRIAGVMAPNSLAGKPLVQTAFGLIALATAPDLPAGTRILLELVANPAPPAAATAPNQAAAPPPAAAQAATGWANFSDAVAVLQKVDPGAAQLLMQRLPDAGQQFMLNAAGWVAAAQTGDMRAWLGDRAVKALEKAGRADLIGRLEDDLGEMRASVTLPRGAGDWQAVTLPFLFEQRIERIRLTMRRQRERDQEEGRDGEEGLRFLVDVDMSRLGALQFDGLVKRNAKSFDLIVRSRRQLPDEVRREIAVIFARALDNMGMIGAAVFKQAVAFVEPIPAHSGGSGVTI